MERAEGGGDYKSCESEVADKNRVLHGTRAGPEISGARGEIYARGPSIIINK